MKKLFALLLALTLAVAVFCLPSAASDTLKKPVATPELTQPTALPAFSDIISIGLTTSPEYATYEKGALTAEQTADIAKLDYGFSVIGVSGIERTVAGAIDGVWTGGNVGEALTNGKKDKGAVAYYWNDTLYNENGVADAANGKYQTLFTFNFGSVKQLDAFAYALSGSKLTAMPQAGDVYVSNDGTTWTLVGGYDRIAKRIAGGDLDNSLKWNNIGVEKDANDGSSTSTSNLVVAFDLNTTAQYLRIATTAPAGITTPADATVYDDYANDATKNCAVREIFVYGKNPEYTVNVTAGENGSVTPTGEVKVPHGESKTFTITAAEGYVVTDILLDGVSVLDKLSAENTFTIENVTADHTLSVSFIQETPHTGDSNVAIILIVTMLISGIGAGILIAKRKKTF